MSHHNTHVVPSLYVRSHLYLPRSSSCIQSQIRASNALYIESHPDVRATLNDFMSAVLVVKPDVSTSIDRSSSFMDHHSHLLSFLDRMYMNLHPSISLEKITFQRIDYFVLL